MHTKDSTQTKSDKIRQSTQEKLDRFREQAKMHEQKVLYQHLKLST